MSIESDVADWNADMAAWRLTPAQRVYHLRRLHQFHRALGGVYLARYDRTLRFERLFGLLAIVSLLLTLTMLVATRYSV